MGYGTIEIKNLSKKFISKEREIEVLEDINLTIESGEVFGIIGVSGAGKSTLVRTMNLLEEPTTGEVLLDGVSLTNLSAEELRKNRMSIGMIFQQFNLLMQRTALANVMFPMEIAGVSKTEASDRAKELLKLVGLEDRMLSYPSQLSGGQKQRVAIARALANHPKVLLCDEATSALDPDTTLAILDLLKEINRRMNISIIIITHEMGVIREICDRVAVIDDKRIVEIGKVAEVFENPNSEITKKFIEPGSNRG